MSSVLLMKPKAFTQFFALITVVVLIVGMVPVPTYDAVASTAIFDEVMPTIDTQVTVVNTATTGVISAISHASTCTLAEASNSNLTQDASSVNLHQPVFCFGFFLGRVSVQPYLFVVDAQNTQSIVVQKSFAQVSVPKLFSTIPNLVPAVMPSLSVAFGVLIFLSSVALVGLKLIASLRVQRYTTNQYLYYLCIQRC